MRKAARFGLTLGLWLLPAPAAAAPELVVHAPAPLASAAARVRGVDLEAFAQVLASAGLAMPARPSVTLVTDTDARAAQLPSWVVGLARGTTEIVVVPERVGPYPYDSLESVVRHEIVHLALNARAAERRLPRWFHEGVATALESGWAARDEVRLLLAALAEPSPADIRRLFESGLPHDNTQAYRLSAALVDEIRRRHGLQVAGAIAARVAEGASFDAAFQAVTGERVETAAERAWRAHRTLSRLVLVASNPSAAWTFILALAALAFVLRVRRRRAQRRRWDEEEEEDGPEEDGPAEDEDASFRS